jgi:predicted GIY-YIG superfamily endonuclease
MSQALYRFFDADDELLYIGITSHLPGRVSEHEGEKPWWTDVERVSVEHFATREEVIEAEREAIRTEGPKHNISHNPQAERLPRTERHPRAKRPQVERQDRRLTAAEVTQVQSTNVWVPHDPNSKGQMWFTPRGTSTPVLLWSNP